MQPAKQQAEALGRKAKLASSYQELLEYVAAPVCDTPGAIITLLWERGLRFLFSFWWPADADGFPL